MKKNLLGLVLLFAVLSSNAQVQALKSVSYRGAFAPAPTAMWTNSWANWDPQNTSYASTTVTVSDSITTNTVWTKNNVYKIQGLIYVTNNATLTIEAGTVIRGDESVANTSLVITRGAKLFAVGTETSPIVFTSNKAVGSRAPGDWGGVILLGKASYNGAGGTSNIEGIAAVPQTTYGGGTTPDDNDNSGTLKYVRIEYGGYVFQPNKEINGLTFGAVGRGTTIDYVQSSFANDDAFEWFGGTVNCTHLIAYRGVDDEFDTDNGFSGTCQFLLGVRDPQIGDATWNISGGSVSEGFESDNDAAGSTNTPLTKAIFSNVTFVGPLRGDASATNQAAIHPAFRRSARIRRNSNLRVINCVMMDYPMGLYIDGSAAVANANAGTLIFANNIVAGNAAGKVIDPLTITSAGFTGVYSWFAANHNDSAVSTSGILTNPYNFTNPDYRPATGSIALSGASFTNSLIAPYVIAEVTNRNFITPVTYRGAFAPAPNAMWTNGWANWDPQNTVYPATTVTVNDSITTNTHWTKNNVYKLQGLIYVTNNATLTIDAGTVIRGDETVANTSLVITRGAKLYANGTVSEPVVFTSNKAVGSRAPGDWGGVILLGKASYNGAGGTSNIEGIAAVPQTTYGGTDDDDNSGSLTYVRIEYGGYVFQPNKEINGLTFGAVGRGTKIDYVQSSFANDDAFEWFGGTVNCSHLISYRGVDDEFDTDNGYSGTCQFLLGVRDPQIGDATWNISGGSVSEGFESDNDAAGSTNSPNTKAIFTNVTFVGPLRGDASATNQAAIHPAFRRSARIRRNSSLRVLNCVMMDYPMGLYVDGSSTVANANAGKMRFSNNIVAGNATGKVIDPLTITSAGFTGVYSWFAANHNDSSVSTTGILRSPYNFTSPDYRPDFYSPAAINYNFADTIFNGLINPNPCVTPTISAITGAACLASTTQATSIYTIDSIAGATYTWTVPTGVTIVSGQGTYKLTVKAASTIVAINGTLSVVVANSCGASASASITLAKNGAIGKIVAVNGSTDPCNGIGTGYSLTYSIAKATNANGYLWTSVGGTVISSNDTTATVRFNHISAGSVSVKPYSACGTDTLWGIVKGLVVKTTLPGATGVISATTDACAGIGSGNSLPLTAATATSANTYVWSTTIVGASIIASSKADSVNVSFPNNFAAGAVAVKAGRVCGTDTFFTAPKSITFKTLLPVKPVAITSADAIALDPCSRLGMTETFSVATTANTTGYAWTTTGVGDSVISSSAQSAVVGFGTNFRSGSLAVKSQRVCGTTTFSSAPISLVFKVALPTTPVVTGLLTPCRNVTGVYKAASTNATSYTWSVATGLSLVSSAVDSAIVTTSPTFTKANLSVYATRACGTTNINSVTKISGLVRPATGCAPGSRQTDANVVNNLADVNVAATVYPNPSRGGFTVTVKNQSKATMATIQIVNLYGQVVKTYNTTNNNGFVNYNIEDAQLNTGLYLVRYIVGETTGTLKLSINK